MTFFLDFDRTLFDTDALYDFAAGNGSVPEPYATTLKTAFAGKADYSSEGWTEFNAALARGDFKYVPDDTKRFLYPDVVDFLKKYGRESTIVTVGLPFIQKAKLEGTGILPFVGEILYAELNAKGDVIKARHPEPLPDAIYVDDSIKQLDSVNTLCSWITVFEMRRDGRPGSGKYPVVHDLAELEAAVLK